MAGIALVLSGEIATAANTQTKLDKVEQRIETGQEREGVLTKRLDQLGARVDSLQAAVDALRDAEQESARRLGEAESELDLAVDRLESSLEELRQTRRRLKISLAALSDRLVGIYMSGSPSIASMVLAADEYGDIVQMGAYLEAIQSRDEALIKRVRELKETARDMVETRRASKQSIQTSRDAIAAETARLASARSETEIQVGSLASAQEASQLALDEVKDGIAQEEEVAAELREKLADELGAITSDPLSIGPSSTPSSNSMIWPIEGTLTSPFGPRWGRTHEGLDIAAPAGTPIVAAASGSVVLMQSEAESGGYGLFTCVDHGGGVSTCYAHQSAFGTSVGASVRQGEVIGYVGNTGNSFGDHVHFEVRINGAPTDPMAYL